MRRIEAIKKHFKPPARLEEINRAAALPTAR